MYLGRRVDKSEKTKLAIDFVKKGSISDISKDRLMGTKEAKGYSNLMIVLDKYLKRM